MANRRLFSLDVVDSDEFLEMPCSSQNLYFHIGVRCDDDGFCNSPNKIIKAIGASSDDLKVLLAKRFLLLCNGGVVLVKHWWLHNTKRKDRYKPSNYLKSNTLYLDENNAYTFNPTNVLYTSSWQPKGNQLATEDKISKDKLSKVNNKEIKNKEIENVGNQDISQSENIDYDAKWDQIMEELKNGYPQEDDENGRTD